MKTGWVTNIIDILTSEYPEAATNLKFSTPFELLIATILSAQCTDERVNKITKKLFKHANTPQAFLDLGQEKLQELIKGAGLYRNKSRNIIDTCKILVTHNRGNIPNQRNSLEKLPGVGRKTANVVLSNAFGELAFPVDTHVYRVAKRIGLASGETPLQVEHELMEVIPKENWYEMHHCLIFHGRAVCKARTPDCWSCGLSHLCCYTGGNL